MTETAATPRPLRLRAADAEDLAVLSAELQDALVPIVDMSYLPEQRQFAMVVNRFMWETAVDGAPGMAGAESDPAGETAANPAAGVATERVYLRTHCGVRFDGVAAVRTRGIDRRDRQQILSLLAIRCEDDAITLHFAGGAMVRLEVGGITAYLADLGDPWPTRRLPCHPLAAPNEIGPPDA